MIRTPDTDARPGGFRDPTGQSATGRSSWSIVIDTAPASERAFEIVAALRDSARTAGPDVLVGGSEAKALDIRDAATRDRLVVIPGILWWSSWFSTSCCGPSSRHWC